MVPGQWYSGDVPDCCVYSIVFCTFMVLNLCQADSEQHQSPIKNHLPITVAKSSTTEMPVRGFAKLGMPF